MKRAFTLVELLITLAIISILSALLYLSFSDSDESAKRAACIGDRETMRTSFAMNKFADDRDFAATVQSVIKEHPKAHLDSAGTESAVCSGICQDGGTYAITRTPSGGIAIVCSKAEHNEILAASATKDIWDKIVDIIKQNNNNFSGSDLWDAIKGAGLITDETKYGNYYFGADKKWGKEENTTLFATLQNEGWKRRTAIEYIYNPNTDSWYKCSPLMNANNLNSLKIFNSDSKGGTITAAMTTNDNKTINYTLTEDKNFRPF